jgi:preprotein translocase subunit SecA
LDDITYEAFAVVREAAKRVLSMRHFDVQLMGGLILHRGMITEMRTGEGKTLVATLPAYLNALTGKGVHIITVNDYLVARDAEWMRKIYEFLDLSVGIIVSGMDDKARKDSYNADITHCTNNELGFDFLRDNMKFTYDQRVQREFSYAIIDEVDSILIDEARTPLIISGPVSDNTDLYLKVDQIVRKLTSEDYEKDEKSRTVNLNENGTNKVEALLAKNGIILENSGLYDFENMYLVHYISQSLKAHTLFSRDVDYLVRDGKVMIIDEFTGRIMDGRRYSEGLHQALEAKENVQIQNENQTLASITFQNYFRMYPKLAGMTGTAMTEAPELKDIYNIDVVAVPTHHTIQRKDHDDEIYGTKEDKYNAIVKQIQESNSKGQPVLVGTISIEKSEEISALLKKHKIEHNVLNAKYHEKEAQIIAQAGRFKSVTIATNMAGRGTDIMLGGNPEMLLEEMDTSSMSDKQLTDTKAKIKAQVDEEKRQVKEAGGLLIIGTERHESRRIDNQLRGRSGRQGDPGETKFYLSLEDDLMRIFASERVSGMLRTLGLKDGEAIHHPMISRSLEKAQQKVEGHHYEIRKNLLKFDDVMNDQRKVIYGQRNEIMLAESVNDTFISMAKEEVDGLIKRFIPKEVYREEWDVEGLVKELHRVCNVEVAQEEILKSDMNEEVLTQNISDSVLSLYHQKESSFGKEMMNNATKYILLTTLDQVWKDHLHYLDHLRQGISLRAYGQKDPLNEYKREAFSLFEKMLDQLQELFVSRIAHLHIDASVNQDSVNLATKKLQNIHTSREDPAFQQFNSGSSLEVPIKPFKAYVDPKERNAQDPETWGKISRNEPCPCNSGKKYKHCHGQN